MTLSTGQANLGGHLVMGKADLGFVSPLTQNATQTSVAVQEPCPCDLFIVAKFGGTVNVNVKVKQATTAALAIAMASPDINQAITTTAETLMHLVLTAGNSYWAMAIVENNAGAPTITELAVASLAQVQLGTYPENLATVKVACASTATPNAGTGVLTLL